jgi:serine/threonine-protein kinase
MTSESPSDRERLQDALGDDFEILEELGRGGMAIVFRARDKALGRDVAIKVLPAHLMKDAALIERFEHEARTAGNLEHPNIIPIYRVGRGGVNADVSYFVMKLLRDDSLSGVLRKSGTLPPDELRTLLIETASALGYAAKHRVVHRDIKPDNILFDSEGRSILTDFGIAKTPEGKHSAPGVLVGSPLYMSPEHALGIPLDGRSDLYSLGVVAYEALVGHPPFADENPLEIIYKHIHEPPPRPELKSAEERELYRVIDRMLAKKPRDRFQSADQLIVALGGQLIPHAITHDPLATAPTAVLTPVMIGSSPESTTRWVTFAAIFALVVGIPTLALVRQRATPKVSPQPPAAPPAVATRQPAPRKVAAPPVSAPEKVAVVEAIKPKPKPPAPPKPSARAAAILAYNKLKSNCAKRDTLVSAKPIPYQVLTDSLVDRPRGDAMTVVYDVCGLSAGSSFTATFTLTKLRQRGFGRQKPHVETTTATVKSPRSRQTRILDMHEMSEGSYRLDLVVTAADKVTSLSREFRIDDK